MEFDFTEGKIIKKLLLFMIPIFIALFLQQLYGAVDGIIVGKFSGNANQNAVNTGSQVMGAFINLVSGLSMGTSILISQAVGKKQKDKSGKIIGAGIFIFIFVVIILTFILTVFSRNFAILLKSPQESLEATVSYIRILGFGSVFLVSYNVLGGIFRGLGDSTTPLITVFIATIINLVLDLVFVRDFGLGAVGAAYATIIAQASSVFLSILIIKLRKFNLNFKLKYIRKDENYTLKTLSLGSPVAINGFLVSFSFVFIQSIANSFGLVIGTGIGVTEKLIGFLLLIPMAFGSGIATYVAQNASALKHKRAIDGVKISTLISLVISIIIIFYVFIDGKSLIRIFNNDPTVIEVSYLYLKAYSFDIFFTVFLFNSIGYFNGYGKTKFTMISGVLGAFLFRIPLSYLFSKILPVNVFLIGLGTPAGTLFQIIISIFFFLKMKKDLIFEENIL